jgi:tetratricopeptide (TPR) repeat protein
MDINDYINQGTAFFQQGKIGPALENLEAALKIQPGNADIRQMVEMLKKQNENLAKGDQASVNEAEHRAAVLGIPVTDVDKAIAEYTEALKRNPNDASAKNSLASAYYIRGLTFTAKREHARAIEDYSEAIKNQPNYPLAFNKRGWANLETENYDQAIEDFKQVIQFNPNDAQAKQNLATAYMKRGIANDKKGDYARAAADFEMVLKFKPNDSTARELLEMAKAKK